MFELCTSDLDPPTPTPLLPCCRRDDYDSINITVSKNRTTKDVFVESRPSLIINQAAFRLGMWFWGERTFFFFLYT